MLLTLKRGLQNLEDERKQLVSIDFRAAQREKAVRWVLPDMFVRRRRALGAEVIVGTLQTLVARAGQRRCIAAVAPNGSVRLWRRLVALLTGRIDHREGYRCRRIREKRT